VPQRALGTLCKCHLSLEKCVKHASLHQSLKKKSPFLLDNHYLRRSISDRGRRTNLLWAWRIRFGKARQHPLTFKHMGRTITFPGKTGMLASRLAGGPCFGVKLQAAFSASFFFFPPLHLLKRTLSKSVLVGSESFDDSELQSTTVLLRL